MENTVLSPIFGNTHEEIVNQIRAIQARIDLEVSCILKEKGVNESDVRLIRKQDGTRLVAN